MQSFTDSELEQIFGGLPHRPLSNSQSKEDILRLSQAFTAFATELVGPWMHGMGCRSIPEAREEGLSGWGRRPSLSLAPGAGK
jgi:hypothetical protein